MNNQSGNNGKCYVLDTNILIGFSIWRPISMSSDFWDKLATALSDKKWVLLDVVVGEIKYNKELEAWCKKQKQGGLITDLDDDSRNRAVEINNTYPMIDSSTAKSTVDTYIIAFAERNKIGVFSRESNMDPAKADALFKIPDVCQKLKVENIRKPETFLKQIGF